MLQLSLNAPSAQSTIIIDDGLLANTSQLHQHFDRFSYSKLVVISNAIVMHHHGDTLMKTLAMYKPLVCFIEDGEQHKNWHSLMRIYDFLLAHNCGRDTLLLAFGGGVVGDVAGFAAATYQRGIPLIQIPTTLLAQVDSSIGGKTGINHPVGKNMIGAFYQPHVVLIDTNTLHTLPERECIAGFAEVIKYALIRDSAFFDWLNDHCTQLRNGEMHVLAHAIATSCQHKIAIVEADEREAGQRALLNLGHTFGHAIERFTNYSQWLHGEAIAVGMRLAAQYSHAEGMLTLSQMTTIHHTLDAFGLPTHLPSGLDAKQFVDIMQLDKKNLASRIRLVLLEDIGNAVVTDGYSKQQLYERMCKTLHLT